LRRQWQAENYGDKNAGNIWGITLEPKIDELFSLDEKLLSKSL